MNQFDKHIHIALDPSDADSIRAALGRYRELLDSGEAFRREMMPLFNVEFVAEEGGSRRRLQPGDAGSMEELLGYALTVVCGSIPREGREEDDLYISEAILFAAALAHPELKGQVIGTAEAMVAYARRRNDSADMFVDDVHLFGLEALFMLAVEHNETAWLLASFYVSHWDTEHEGSYDQLLPILVQANGWSRDMLLAYLYCDNAQVRRAFNHPASVPELADHFGQHPEDYDWFCEQLAQRLAAQPLLAVQGDGSLSDIAPVLGFFHSMRDRWPVAADPYEQDQWRDQVNRQPFMGNTLEDCAFAVYSAIRAESDNPLVITADAHQLRGDEEDENPFDDHFTAALNFISGLDQGQGLRAYVLGQTNGEEVQSLLAQLEPYDFNSTGHSDRFLLNLYQWLEPPFSNADLVAVFPFYFWDLLEDCPGGGEQGLCFLDIFWHLLGRPQFPRAIADGLVRQEALLSEADYCQRYQQQEASTDERLEAFSEELEELEDDEPEWSLLQELDEQTRANQALLVPEHWPCERGAFIYAAWCAQRLDVADSTAGRMAAWLDQYLMPALCGALQEQGYAAVLQYLTEAQPGTFDEERHLAIVESFGSQEGLSQETCARLSRGVANLRPRKPGKQQLQEVYAQLCLGGPAEGSVNLLFWL